MNTVSMFIRKFLLLILLPIICVSCSGPKKREFKVVPLGSQEPCGPVPADHVWNANFASYYKGYCQVIERVVRVDKRSGEFELKDGERVRVVWPKDKYVAGDFRYPRIKDFKNIGMKYNKDLLMAVYGDSQSQVEQSLEEVSFLGIKVMFNSKNGAARALRLVSNELASLAAKNPGLRAYLERVTSSFYMKGNKKLPFTQAFPIYADKKWVINPETGQPSTHSLGIAIDIIDRDYNAEFTFWRDKLVIIKGEAKILTNMDYALAKKSYQSLVKKARQGKRRIFVQPHRQVLIDVFEKHGFIYGGKWSLYDMAHYEYRPALLTR